jgi:hypothetical protein
MSAYESWSAGGRQAWQICPGSARFAANRKAADAGRRTCAATEPKFQRDSCWVPFVFRCRGRRSSVPLSCSFPWQPEERKARRRRSGRRIRRCALRSILVAVGTRVTSRTRAQAGAKQVRPGAFCDGWESTTPPSTQVGSTGSRSRSQCCAADASTGASTARSGYQIAAWEHQRNASGPHQNR